MKTSTSTLTQVVSTAVESPVSPVDPASPELDRWGCLGDYRLVREIGRGGMGTVYEAEQISLGRRVALKVLPLAAALEAKQLQRFKNEAQAAAHLHHQNIVPVHAVGCERGVHYFAMQFIAGQSLAVTIAEMRLSQTMSGDARPGPAVQLDANPTLPYTPYLQTKAPLPREPNLQLLCADVLADTANSTAVIRGDSIGSLVFLRTMAHLGVQAAEALEHAHAMGVVHRDIKPSNLLVDDCGKLWVTDFGLAHCQSQAGLTMTGDLIGTLRYMSPEQALAQHRAIDHRTDIYSLGATLYELLTLEPAYPGRDRQELLRQIAFEEPRQPRRLNRAIPRELETIVLKAMEKNPADRYATAQELAEDLGRFLKDEQIRAKRPTLLQRGRRWGRRHQPIVWSALVATVVASLLAVGVLAVSNVRIARETAQKEQALKDKHAALTAAKAAQEQAVENLDDARAAVDKMLTRVADRLGAVPQMEHVRRELLEDALKLYQKFLGKNGDDPGIRWETAWTYRRLALIQRSLGRLVEAEQSYRKYFAMIEELETQSPLEPSARAALVRAHLQFAGLRFELGSREDQEKHLHRAVRMAEHLVKEFPNDQVYCDQLVNANYHLITQVRRPPDEEEQLLRRNLKLTDDPHLVGNIYFLLANLSLRQGRYAEAERDYLKSFEKFQAIAAQYEMGGALLHMAEAVAANGRGQEAEALYRRAAAIVDKLATDHPGFYHFRTNQAGMYCNHANVLKKLRRTADAEKAYRRAVELYEKLAADFPTLPVYQQTVCDQRLELGRFLVDVGKPQDARHVYGEAIALSGKAPADLPARLKHGQGLIRCHIELGRLLEKSGTTPEAEQAFRQALAISERLEAEHGGKPKYRPEVTRGHLEAAWLLRFDSRPSEAEQPRLRALEHYVRLAGEDSQAQHARQGLALAHFLMADHYRWTAGRLRDSEKLFRQALEEYQELSADFPEVSHYRIFSADSRERLASVFQFQGRLQEAEQALKEVLPLAERLAQEHPADGAARMTFAMASRRWGETVRDKAAPQEVEKAFRRAEAILEKLAADFPRDKWHRFEWGVTCQMLVALLARDLKQPEEAEKMYRRGVDVFEKLTAEFPSDPVCRARLGDAHREWASCLLDIGRKQEAMELFALAVANFSQATELGSTDVWGVWYPLALVHLSTGRIKEYRALCETLLDRFGQADDPDFHVVAICRLAPDAVADPARLVRIVEKMLARKPHNADRAGVLGDALYRKGDLDAAVQRLEASIRAPRGIGVHWRKLFLAMAYHRQGRTAEAQQLLQETTQWMETNAQEKLAEGAELKAPLPWRLRLELQLLRHETEQLLGIEDEGTPAFQDNVTQRQS